MTSLRTKIRSWKGRATTLSGSKELVRSMEESVSKLQNVVVKALPGRSENLPSMSNKEHGMDQATKRWKLF